MKIKKSHHKLISQNFLLISSVSLAALLILVVQLLQLPSPKVSSSVVLGTTTSAETGQPVKNFMQDWILNVGSKFGLNKDIKAGTNIGSKNIIAPNKCGKGLSSLTMQNTTVDYVCLDGSKGTFFLINGDITRLKTIAEKSCKEFSNEICQHPKTPITKESKCDLIVNDLEKEIYSTAAECKTNSDCQRLESYTMASCGHGNRPFINKTSLEKLTAKVVTYKNCLAAQPTPAVRADVACAAPKACSTEGQCVKNKCSNTFNCQSSLEVNIDTTGNSSEIDYNNEKTYRCPGKDFETCFPLAFWDASGACNPKYTKWVKANCP